MRYVVMANGLGTRWDNHQGIPKHLISIDGETLLQRIVRLVHHFDPEAEVIIASANEHYEVDGARRHTPERSSLEIDRFTYELIEGDICFLYGDTYYTEEAMELILATPVERMHFFGSEKTIFAVKSEDDVLFRGLIDRIREMHLKGDLPVCKGWQLYQAFAGLPFGGPCVGSNYTLISDRTGDFNYPHDYDRFVSEV